MNANEDFFESEVCGSENCELESDFQALALETGNALESPAEGTQMQEHQFQKLTPEDALSYICQVKSTFESQPQAYNDFLDILKKFCSQSIDVPDFFQQLSNLFRGHPELIVGFNSHLPLGYRIEVHPKEQIQVDFHHG